MDIGGGQAFQAIDRLAIAVIRRPGPDDRQQRCLALRVMESVALQAAFRQIGELHAERGQPFLHYRNTGQQAGEGVGFPGLVGDLIEQAHHAAALGK